MSARKAAKAHHRIREGKQAKAPEKVEIQPSFIRQAANLLHQKATVEELKAEVMAAEATVARLEKEVNEARNRCAILTVDLNCEIQRLGLMTSTHTAEAWRGSSPTETEPSPPSTSYYTVKS